MFLKLYLDVDLEIITVNIFKIIVALPLFFQNSVEKDAVFLIGAFEAQNKVLVGVNKYLNQLENKVDSNNTGRNINNVVKTLNEINLDNHIKTGGN